MSDVDDTEIRQKVAGIRVGDTVYVNGYGPFYVTSRESYGDRRSGYTDTMFKMWGHRDEEKRELWRIKLYCNDSGKRGSGRPGWHSYDPDEGQTGGGNTLSSLEFEEEVELIESDRTADDLVGDVR